MARPALHRALAHLRSEPSRTWSLIITVFGDAVVPRGGSVWLGTLLLLFRAMGIGEGVVRTAVSRLATDGWLERERVGRNSFYRLGPKGRATFRGALRCLTPSSPEAMRAAGFGSPSPGLWLAPAGTPLPVGTSGDIHLVATGGQDANRALAARAWPLDETAEAYRRFIQAFGPLREALEAGEDLSDLEALVGRVLVIHEYRRIVLRDPTLPAEILPTDWQGTSARGLCAAIYPRLTEPSERWLDENAVDERGERLPPNREIGMRFAKAASFLPSSR